MYDGLTFPLIVIYYTLKKDMNLHMPQNKIGMKIDFTNHMKNQSIAISKFEIFGKSIQMLY